MDARLEGYVDVVHAVGGEEENAGVILQVSEEDCDWLVGKTEIQVGDLDLLETSWFLSMLLALLCSRKTSASSISRMQPSHFVHISRMLDRFCSTS